MTIATRLDEVLAADTHEWSFRESELVEYHGTLYWVKGFKHNLNNGRRLYEVISQLNNPKRDSIDIDAIDFETAGKLILPPVKDKAVE